MKSITLVIENTEVIHLKNDIIVTSCEKLLKSLCDTTPKEVFFDRCVENRLLAMYEQSDKEYDKELHDLEVSINYNDFKRVKRCVTRIMSTMSKNRKNLINTLERIGG